MFRTLNNWTGTRWESFFSLTYKLIRIRMCISLCLLSAIILTATTTSAWHPYGYITHCNICHKCSISYTLFYLGGRFLTTDLTSRSGPFFGDLDVLVTSIGPAFQQCIRDLLHHSDTELFWKMCLPGDSLTICFIHNVPIYKPTNLHSRRHNFQLPDSCSAIHKNIFVIRTLLCTAPVNCHQAV